MKRLAINFDTPPDSRIRQWKTKDLRDKAGRFSWSEDSEDFVEAPDHRTQLEATKEINRLLDAYPAEKQQAEPLTINLTVNMEL